MNDLMLELQNYLTDNFISFKSIENKENTLLINGETYELFSINEDGRFFDESFHWDNDKTEEDNYIFCFGSIWYSLKKGNENSVKLERVKWLGSVEVEERALLQENFLGIHGPFELMNGMGNYKDWCKKAKFLGVKTLGLCEKGTLAGTLKFQTACQKEGIRSILGMEVPVQIANSDSRYSIKAFVKNEKGWRNLLWLNKIINVDGEGFVSEKDLKECSEGLIVVYDPKTVDFNSLPSEVWLKDRAYFQLDTVVYEKEERDEFYLKNLKRFFGTKMKPVLMSDAYYLEKEYAPIRGKLNRLAETMNYESNNQYFKNGEEFYWELAPLFNESDFERLFATFEEASNNLNDICNSCNFTIDTSQRHLPKYYMTLEEEKRFPSNEEMFRELVYEGVEQHPDLLENFSVDVVAERIEREIEVIQNGGVVDYFLILRDIVNWCKSEGILLGAGRGSSAGSICAYLLGLTYANPLKYGLLFERFLNEGRAKVSLPDIDQDIASEKRPLVKEYMERRFGIDQVCSVGTYTTMQIKAAMADLCRLEGIPIQEVRRITAKFGDEGEKSIDDFLKTVSASEELRNFVIKHSDVINDMFVILGQPKAASIHACALIVFPDEKTMFSWAPVRKQKDMIISEWEGGELDAAGFLKDDILGVAQLDKFYDILNLIEKNTGKRIDIYKDIPLDDPTVYGAMGKGFLSDVFHFGSRGLSSYTVQMKPRNIEELSDCAALYRPGSIENNFHNEYLLRRSGEKEVNFHTGTEKILENTQALFVYQEQIMALMHELAGMDLVTCDVARKAMGKKKIEVIQTLESQFIEGYCSRHKVTESYAKEFWDEIVKSSSYLFNKCISGREQLHRNPNRKDSLAFHPTIEEMYKICNSRVYAESTGHKSLHFKYRYRGYGGVWFLDIDNRIRKASIKDIRFSGIRQTFKITLANGKTISTTDNHFFPTLNGKVLMKDLKVGDEFYCLEGYENRDSMFRYTIENNSPGTRYEYVLNSEKGKKGFQKNPNSIYMKNKNNLSQKPDDCEKCGRKYERLELHHIDGDHGNESEDNLVFLCPSCHKKEHYAMGRKKQGDKGLLSALSKITSIEKDQIENVYDIEVDHPQHNFLTKRGIITCNSHSVSYSINGYNSMWLKIHYPIEFWAVTFSRAKMEEFPFYLNEIKNSGSIEVKPVNINKSQINIIADPSTNSMYWAFNSVDQVGEKAQAQLIEERDMCGEYFSLDEFIDRQMGTGSTVNKSVVENLIYSGAFDEIEKISSIQERGNLLQRVREVRKIKIDPTKDEYTLACLKGKQNTDWWWRLQQKKKSGFAYFDYEVLVEQYLRKSIGKEWTFITGDEVRDWTEKKSGYKVCAGGYVIEMQERKSKKGPFCNLVLECNYEFIKVLVFPELFEEYQDFLRGCKDSLLLLNGNIIYNKFHNAFVLQTSQSTEFVKVGNI